MRNIKLVLSALVVALTGFGTATKAAPAPAAKNEPQSGVLKVSRPMQNMGDFRATPSN